MDQSSIPPCVSNQMGKKELEGPVKHPYAKLIGYLILFLVLSMLTMLPIVLVPQNMLYSMWVLCPYLAFLNYCFLL